MEPPSPLNEPIEPSDAEFEITIDADLEYDSDPEDEDTTIDLEEEETLPGTQTTWNLSSNPLTCIKEMLMLPLNVSKRLTSSICS
jgi:hypothetical protein